MLEVNPDDNKIEQIYDLKGKNDIESETKMASKDDKSEQENKRTKVKKKSKKKKAKKGLKKLKEIEVKEEKKSKFSLGEVRYAEMHKQATKPLRHIHELTNEELKNYSCPCCGLPSQVSGKLEPYEMCDNPDDFSNCGQGVVLYYSYIKFVIFSIFIASLCISGINIYYSYKYTYELRKVCNNYYHNELKPHGNRMYVEECKLYFTEADKDSEFYNLIDSFFFQFSLPNVKDYRELYQKINTDKSKDFESTIVNLSFTNFICLVIIFIYNLIYIYFLFNKSNAADYLVFTVSDYAVFLTNLYDIYDKFKEYIKKKDKDKDKDKEKIENIDDKDNEKESSKKKKKKSKGKILNVDKSNSDIKDNKSKLDQFKDYLNEKIFRMTRKEKKEKNAQDYGINRIDLCFKLEEMVKLQKQLDEIDEKQQRIEFDPYISEKNKEFGLEGDNRYFYSDFLGLACCCETKESLKDIKKNKVEIETKINELIKASKEDTDKYFGGAAFITFNTIKQQEEYLSKLPSNFFDYLVAFFKKFFYIFCSCCSKKDSLGYYKRHIIFEAAPEPEDVIFENLETKPFWRAINTIIVYLISIIICGVSFIAIVALNKLQVKVDKNKEDKTTHTVLLYVISFGITGVTSAIDIILEIVLEKLTKWEKQTTWTNFYLSYSLKLTLFSFLNSAVLPIVCEFVINKSNGYQFLINNMLMKFLVNSFVTTIMWTINVGCVLKSFRQCIIEKKDKDKIGYNQKELNEIYELPPMNVAAKYSYIGKTLLMSFLYIPIFPLGLGISLLGFILGYWLEKYNFANMYKKPEMLNRQIVEFYLNYFVLIFFVYGISDYVFLKDAYENKIWSLVNIIVFGVLIIIPYHQLLSIDFLKFEESQIHEQEYNEKYVDFLNDYQRANPMTAKEGKKRYNEELEKRHKISHEELEKRKKQIEEENPYKYYQGPNAFNSNNNFLLNEGGINNYLVSHWLEGNEEEKKMKENKDKDSDNEMIEADSTEQKL